MAPRKLPTLTELSGTKAPTLPGRVDRQGMDRERSNPDSSGDSPTKEQGSSPIIREHGGRGTGESKAEGNKGDRELSIPATSDPTSKSAKADVHKTVIPPIPIVYPIITEKPENNPFLTGDHILKAITDKFVELRENQKIGAWKQLQSDLMRAVPFIVPHIIPLKDIIQIAADIEKEIKGSTAQVGRSNEELLANFLNGGDAIELSNTKVEESTNV